jgi:23S rRNA pseudouridine1911/1915/1917 synthase
VHGVPASAEDVVQQPLRRDPLDRRRVIVDPAGQTAITRYRVLAAGESMALLLVAPETGRTHQIRAHLAWLGHPLVGDDTYANVTHVGPMPAGIRDAARQMLHAWSLEVRHPLTGETLQLWASLPPDLAALLPDDWRARCTPQLFEDT